MRADRLAGVEEGAAALGDLAMDRPGDHVAGREVGHRVVGGHERPPLGVDQHRALAAQGLAGQGRRVEVDVDGGGVELDELGIGDLSPRQGRQRQALAADGDGIGGDGVEAAQAAGGEDGGRGGDLHQSAAHLGQHAAHTTFGVGQQGPSAGLVTDLDLAAGDSEGADRLHDRPSGLVALDPGHAGAAVGGFQALGEAAGGVAVEGRAEIGQAAHRLRAFAGQEFGPGGVDQAGARGDGVGRMQGRRIVLGQGRGHAALRPGGRTALQQRRGGQDQRLAGRAGEGGREARKARPHDQDAVESLVLNQQTAPLQVSCGKADQVTPAHRAKAKTQRARDSNHCPTLILSAGARGARPITAWATPRPTKTAMIGWLSRTAA